MNLNMTFFVQLASFLILLFLLSWRVLKPLGNFLDERANRIRSELEKANRLVEEAERNRKETQRILHNAQEEAVHIRRNAEREADRYYKEQVAKTKSEIDKMLESAQAEINLAVKNAKAELRAELAEIIVKASAKILAREIKEEDHEAILREAIEAIENGKG